MTFASSAFLLLLLSPVVSMPVSVWPAMQVVRETPPTVVGTPMPPQPGAPQVVARVLQPEELPMILQAVTPLMRAMTNVPQLTTYYNMKTCQPGVALEKSQAVMPSLVRFTPSNANIYSKDNASGSTLSKLLSSASQECGGNYIPRTVQVEKKCTENYTMVEPQKTFIKGSMQMVQSNGGRLNGKINPCSRDNYPLPGAMNPPITDPVGMDSKTLQEGLKNSKFVLMQITTYPVLLDGERIRQLHTHQTQHNIGLFEDDRRKCTESKSVKSELNAKNTKEVESIAGDKKQETDSISGDKKQDTDSILGDKKQETDSHSLDTEVVQSILNLMNTKNTNNFGTNLLEPISKVIERHSTTESAFHPEPMLINLMSTGVPWTQVVQPGGAEESDGPTVVKIMKSESNIVQSVELSGAPTRSQPLMTIVELDNSGMKPDKLNLTNDIASSIMRDEESKFLFPLSMLAQSDIKMEGPVNNLDHTQVAIPLHPDVKIGKTNSDQFYSRDYVPGNKIVFPERKMVISESKGVQPGLLDLDTKTIYSKFHMLPLDNRIHQPERSMLPGTKITHSEPVIIQPQSTKLLPDGEVIQIGNGIVQSEADVTQPDSNKLTAVELVLAEPNQEKKIHAENKKPLSEIKPIQADIKVGLLESGPPGLDSKVAQLENKTLSQKNEMVEAESKTIDIESVVIVPETEATLLNYKLSDLENKISQQDSEDTHSLDKVITPENEKSNLDNSIGYPKRKTVHPEIKIHHLENIKDQPESKMSSEIYRYQPETTLAQSESRSIYPSSKLWQPENKTVRVYSENQVVRPVTNILSGNDLVSTQCKIIGRERKTGRPYNKAEQFETQTVRPELHAVNTILRPGNKGYQSFALIVQPDKKTEEPRKKIAGVHTNKVKILQPESKFSQHDWKIIHPEMKVIKQKSNIPQAGSVRNEQKQIQKTIIPLPKKYEPSTRMEPTAVKVVRPLILPRTIVVVPENKIQQQQVEDLPQGLSQLSGPKYAQTERNTEDTPPGDAMVLTDGNQLTLLIRPELKASKPDISRIQHKHVSGDREVERVRSRRNAQSVGLQKTDFYPLDDISVNIANNGLVTEPISVSKTDVNQPSLITLTWNPYEKQHFVKAPDKVLQNLVKQLAILEHEGFARVTRNVEITDKNPESVTMESKYPAAELVMEKQVGNGLEISTPPTGILSETGKETVVITGEAINNGENGVNIVNEQDTSGRELMPELGSEVFEKRGRSGMSGVSDVLNGRGCMKFQRKHGMKAEEGPGIMARKEISKLRKSMTDVSKNVFEVNTNRLTIADVPEMINDRVSPEIRLVMGNKYRSEITSDESKILHPMESEQVPEMSNGDQYLIERENRKATEWEKAFDHPGSFRRLKRVGFNDINDLDGAQKNNVPKLCGLKDGVETHMNKLGTEKEAVDVWGGYGDREKYLNIFGDSAPHLSIIETNALGRKGLATFHTPLEIYNEDRRIDSLRRNNLPFESSGAESSSGEAAEYFALHRRDALDGVSSGSEGKAASGGAVNTRGGGKRFWPESLKLGRKHSSSTQMKVSETTRIVSTQLPTSQVPSTIPYTMRPLPPPPPPPEPPPPPPPPPQPGVMPPPPPPPVLPMSPQPPLPPAPSLPPPPPPATHPPNPPAVAGPFMHDLAAWAVPREQVAQQAAQGRETALQTLAKQLSILRRAGYGTGQGPWMPAHAGSLGTSGSGWAPQPYPAGIPNGAGSAPSIAMGGVRVPPRLAEQPPQQQQPPYPSLESLLQSELDLPRTAAAGTGNACRAGAAGSRNGGAGGGAPGSNVGGMSGALAWGNRCGDIGGLVAPARADQHWNDMLALWRPSHEKGKFSTGRSAMEARGSASSGATFPRETTAVAAEPPPLRPMPLTYQLQQLQQQQLPLQSLGSGRQPVPTLGPAPVVPQAPMMPPTPLAPLPGAMVNYFNLPSRLEEGLRHLQFPGLEQVADEVTSAQSTSVLEMGQPNRLNAGSILEQLSLDDMVGTRNPAVPESEMAPTDLTVAHGGITPAITEESRGAGNITQVDSASAAAAALDAASVVQSIMHELHEIERERSAAGATREGLPCGVEGSWVSDAIGVRLDITCNGKRRRAAADGCNESNVDRGNFKAVGGDVTNGNGANAKVNGYMGSGDCSVLGVEVEDCIPPNPNRLLTSGWKLKGSAPFPRAGLFLLTGANPNKKQMLSFMGQCRVCGGADTITGVWVMAHEPRDCRDTHMFITEYRDVFRREMLHNLRAKRLREMNTTKYSPPLQPLTSAEEACAFPLKVHQLFAASTLQNYSNNPYLANNLA